MKKTNLLGIGVSRTTYEEGARYVLDCAKAGRRCLVACAAVHNIMLGYFDPAGHGKRLNEFDLVTPDGQPVRWAINLLRERGEICLKERVYGPTLTLEICAGAEQEGLGVFFLGSTVDVLGKLTSNLQRRFPGLRICGELSPPFRAVTPEEDAGHVARINGSGADLVFVGLGCPRQEQWVYEHRERIEKPLLAVGAAFDFHAGSIPQAPAWMQRRGLEWLFRLRQEPRRLWKRYVYLNPLYVWLVFLQKAGLKRF